MNNQILTNPAPLYRRLAIAMVLVLAALLAIPAAGQAHSTKKFGADLSTGAQPVQTPVTCPNTTKACTHVPVFYYEPAHVGDVPNAPKNGTVTQIKLRSATSGSLRVEMAETMGSAPNFRAELTRVGPKLHYKASNKVQTFNVNIPVLHGQWLALESKALGAMSCSQGDLENDGVFQNALQLGDSFQLAGSYTDCTPLVQAVMH